MSTSAENTVTVALPGKFVDWLSGSQAWQTGEDDPDVIAFVNAVQNGRTTNHGRLGYSVEATVDRGVLIEYVEYFYTAARDDAAWEPSAKAEVAAARKIMARIGAE